MRCVPYSPSGSYGKHACVSMAYAQIDYISLTSNVNGSTLLYIRGVEKKTSVGVRLSIFECEMRKIVNVHFFEIAVTNIIK